MMYVLKTPQGKLIEWTASVSKDDCWQTSFSFLCDKVPSFERGYWKRWDESIAASKKLGYKIVKVKLTEV